MRHETEKGRVMFPRLGEFRGRARENMNRTKQVKTVKVGAKQALASAVTPAQKAEQETIVAFKGFDKNLSCRGFQFEVGKSYDHAGPVEICDSGFHACEHPLHVLRYYPAASSRFAIVKQSGNLKRHEGDSKVASAKITIEAELTLPQLIERAVKWVFDRAKWSDAASVAGANEGATASGDYGAATASGNSGAATASGNSGAATASGNCGAATASGDCGAATASGDYGAATASGYCGAATASGYCGVATASGNSGAATASGYRGVATASGDYGAATASGDCGAATASGNSGAATASGYCGAATASGNSGAATASGDCGAATASGRYGKAKAAEGSALFLVYRDQDWKITHAWAGVAGRDGIEAMTWYRLDENGKPVEVDD